MLAADSCPIICHTVTPYVTLSQCHSGRVTADKPSGSEVVSLIDSLRSGPKIFFILEGFFIELESSPLKVRVT